MNPPTDTWSRKRKLTTIAFAVQSALIGCEVAIVYVNMWIYMETLVKPANQKFYYSFISLSFTLSAALLSTFISRFADKYRNIRKLFFITNTLYIVGNAIYMLHFSPWLLVAGRLIAGGGVAQGSIMMGELGRCYPKDELTAKISLISMTSAFGYIIAPAMNAAFTSVKFSIGELRITFANISGFYIPALFVGSQIMCFFMVHDLSKEYDLKAHAERSDGATQQHVRNCFADTDIELSSPTVISRSDSNLKLKETITNEVKLKETRTNEAYTDEDSLNNSDDHRKREANTNEAYTDEDSLNNSDDNRKPAASTNEAYTDEDPFNNSHDNQKPETSTNEAYTDEDTLSNLHDHRKRETNTNEAYTDEDSLNNSHDHRKREVNTNETYTDEDSLNNSHDNQKPETRNNEAYTDEDSLSNLHDHQKREAETNEAYTDEDPLNNSHDNQKPETRTNETYTDEDTLSNLHDHRKRETSTDEAYTDEDSLNNSHDNRKPVAVVRPSRLSTTDVTSNDTSNEKVNDNEIKNEKSISAPCERSNNAVKAENVSGHSSNLYVEMDDTSTSNNPVQFSIPPPASDDLKCHELTLKHYNSEVKSSTMEQPSNVCDSNNQVETSPLHSYSIPDKKVDSTVIEMIQNLCCSQTSNGARKPSLSSHNSTSDSDIGGDVMDVNDDTSSNRSNIVAPGDTKASTRWMLLKMLTTCDTCVLLVVCLFENFLMVTYTLIMPIIVLDILQWSETALNGILFGQAVSCVFPCLALICRKFTDQQIFYFSVASLAAYVIITLTQIILVKEKEHFTLNVVLCAAYCILFSNVTVIKSVFLGGFLIKMVSSKYQSVGDSIRLLMVRLGAIAAMLSSPFIIEWIDIIGSAYIIILFVLAVLLIVRRNTLKAPTVIIQ